MTGLQVLEEPFSNVTIRTEAVMTFTVSGGQFGSGTATITMTYSGGNINQVWGEYSSYFGMIPGATVNNANHSVTFTQPMDFNPTDG